MKESQRPSERTAGQGDADQELGYEQARDELLDVVRALEAGGATLEESLALWERGERLAEICQAWLDGARQRLDAARAGRTAPQGESAGRREPESEPAGRREPGSEPAAETESQARRNAPASSASSE